MREVLPGMAGTYEVTVGQGFGTTRMGHCMPMWLELATQSY
jgi:hypothetical protein